MYKELEEPVLTDINSLMSVCRLGFGGNFNNGYGCLAPEDDKESDLYCCFAHNCPLVSLADMSDLKKLDKDAYDEYREMWDGKYDEDDEANMIPQESFDVPVMQYREWVWKSRDEIKAAINRLMLFEVENDCRDKDDVEIVMDEMDFGYYE